MVLLRLGSILGRVGQKNDIVYASNSKQTIKELTCYFGGDVQNYPEIMESHENHGKYIQWNVLQTATLLASKFPLSAILVILPSRFELKTFSCYDNFVPSSKLGNPNHTPMANAIEHLQLIIKNSLSSFHNKIPYESDSCHESIDFSCLDLLNTVERINLVGFSKGCIVLNQLITEVNTISTTALDSNLLKFWKKVKNIYWLDGGHSGGKNTWVKDQSVLKTLAACDVKVHVHVSPYQIDDDRRPWIRKECKAFVSGLKKASGMVSYNVHFKDSPSSLDNHFKVIDVFKQNDN